MLQQLNNALQGADRGTSKNEMGLSQYLIETVPFSFGKVQIGVFQQSFAPRGAVFQFFYEEPTTPVD